jgi:hypothetical protein
MCYEFDSFYSKARIAEQLRKKAEEQKRRDEAHAPPQPVETEPQVKTPETVPA